MTHLTTALLAVLVCLSLLNIALTRQAVRLPMSSCEHHLARFVVQPFEGKGTLPAEFVEPPTAEEILVTQDARLMP